MKCAETEHNYLKFDDSTVVCTKCADQRVVDVAALIARLPQPIYLPCPGPHHWPYIAPYVPWWQPNTTWPVITYGTSTAPLPDNVTVVS